MVRYNKHIPGYVSIYSIHDTNLIVAGELYVLDAIFAMHVSSFTADPILGQHSVLWNAMIYPFLNMTIKGAISRGNQMQVKACYLTAVIYADLDR